MARMHKEALLSYLFLLVLFNGSLCEESIVVNLEQGTVSGKVENSFQKHKEYFAFRGIPYAEPPIGTLRFKPPKPLLKWDGIHEAYENKPTCLQFCARMRNREPYGVYGSEDCLYLSVYTPSLDGDYPVVVFDFNDNFKTGFNGSDTYSPDFFIDEDVIVVTITHRLNIFGFLTTEDNVIPANNGIRDFVLGLNWVKNNIEKFGGNPSKVTLMGYKGGAVIANLLLYTDQAKGLFSAVILQGGTVLEPKYFYENPREKAFQLAKILDIQADDSQTLLKELQKVDATTLIRNEVMVLDDESLKKYQLHVNIFAPTVERDHENAIITALPEKSKIVVDVPVIIGLTSREGLDLIDDFLSNPELIEKAMGSVTMLLPIRPGFRFDRESTVYQRNASTEINEMYYKDGYLHLDNILQYSVLLGDTLTSYAIDKTAKILSRELSSSVFYYMFDFRGLLNENMEIISRYSRLNVGQWGATVTDDLCYLFLCSRLRKTYENFKSLITKQPEIKTLEKMVRLWTNFAKTRNPTSDQKDNMLKGVIWTPVDKDSKDAKYLHISKSLKMKKEPLGARAKFWDRFLNKYLKLSVDGVVTDTDGTNGDEINNEDLTHNTKYRQTDESLEKESQENTKLASNNEKEDKKRTKEKVKDQVEHSDEKEVIIEDDAPSLAIQQNLGNQENRDEL